MTTAKTVVFRNLTLLDGTASDPLPDAAILVEGERIRAIGRAADFGSAIADRETHDLGGRIVLPGLINAHEHITWRRGLGSFEERVVRQPAGKLLLRGFGHALISLLEGVTTVRDVGSKDGLALDLRDAIDARRAYGPRIVTSGYGIKMAGGHGSSAGPTADGVSAVKRAVRERLKAGVDFIKLMASGGLVGRGLDRGTIQQYTFGEMHAAFEEAHKAGKPSTVHAHPPAAIRTAIEAGVDCIEHAGLIDAPTAELVAQRNVFVVPTLSGLRMEVERGETMGRPASLVAACQARLHDQPRVFGYLREAGCKIVAGVDSLGDVQGELAFMVEYGLSPREAIQAATAVAAQCLELADQVGTLEPGKMADFIAVDGDPLHDIRALRNVALTVKGGMIFRPEALRAVIPAGLLTDFG